MREREREREMGSLRTHTGDMCCRLQVRHMHCQKKQNICVVMCHFIGGAAFEYLFLGLCAQFLPATASPGYGDVLAVYQSMFLLFL